MCMHSLSPFPKGNVIFLNYYEQCKKKKKDFVYIFTVLFRQPSVSQVLGKKIPFLPSVDALARVSKL